MIRHIILIAVLLALFVAGCRTTSEKRVNKDITGINEQLYELEKNQIKDSSRIKKLESMVGQAPAKKTPEPIVTEEKEIDAESIYKEGYQKFLEQNYVDSIRILSRITDRFKDDSLIEKALFWQAESYMKTNQPALALNYYQMLYRYFPFSNKADSALFKIGQIYTDMGDANRAQLAFERLLAEYPGSDLFKTVSIKLKEIKEKNKNRSK